MLGIPGPTSFDLNFRLFGIPIRVHPLFWLIGALIFWDQSSPRFTMIGVACMFVSILVHELGHGLTSRAFGARPAIVLYAFGGLCASPEEQRHPGRRLLVLFMGPIAGFLLAGLVLATWFGLIGAGVTVTEPVGWALRCLLLINIIWGLLNLLPIWPLDGGQIIQVILHHFSPGHGIRRSHIVSFLTAGGLAVLVGLGLQDIYLAIWMAYFAFMNFQLLNYYHRLAMAERRGY